MFEYKMSEEQVNTLLEIINRTQMSGVQGAKIILSLVELLQNPTNKNEIEKEQFEALKAKFEKKDK